MCVPVCVCVCVGCDKRATNRQQQQCKPLLFRLCLPAHSGGLKSKMRVISAQSACQANTQARWYKPTRTASHKHTHNHTYTRAKTFIRQTWGACYRGLCWSRTSRLRAWPGKWMCLKWMCVSVCVVVAECVSMCVYFCVWYLTRSSANQRQ